MSIRNGTSGSGRCEGELTEEGGDGGVGMPGSTGRRRSTTCSWPTRTATRCSRRRSRMTRRAGCAVPDARAAGSGAGRDRAAGRAVGRAAAGRGAAGVGVASEQGRGGARPVPGLGREVRSVRRVRAVRARAHRPSPLPGARARLRSDEGDPGADPCAGGSRRRAHRGGQPAARGARAVLARAAAAVQPHGRGDPARVP